MIKRSLLFTATCIYALGFFAGYILPMFDPTKINGKVDLYAYELPDKSFYDILENNLLVILLIIAGSITFSVLTFINLTSNSIIFGILIKSSLLVGVTLKKILILTLPHAIFEIPAIIIAGAAGFKIPYEIIRYLAGKKETILTKEDIKEYLTLALISITLIIIAAWIEANVTLRIAESMLKE